MKKAGKLAALLLTITIMASCFAGTSVLAAGTNSNSSNDFQIQDGVLTKYNGNGGKVAIPDGVTQIDANAFSDFENITSVSIPNSVTYIGGGAFTNCTGLTSITIPQNVNRIDYNVFCGCTNLASIKVDSKNSHFSSGNGVLFNKSKTVLLDFPAGYPQKTYVIPQQVTTIESYAFFECRKLTGVTIPNSVNAIMINAFAGCDKITHLTLPDSVTSINSSAFDECSSLTAISVSSQNKQFCSVDGILFSKNKSMILKCPAGYPQKTYVIPNSVTNIEQSAFNGCSKLTNIVIPTSVTSIGHAAFNGCLGLTDIVIPSSVTDIEDNAFNGCNKLVHITIPTGLTKIGGYAFEGTPWLDNFTEDSVIVNHMLIKYKGKTNPATIPSGVTKINDSAFEFSNLTDIVIPNGVTSIGNYAFMFCKNLNSISIPESVSFIGGYAFDKKVTLIGYDGSYAQTYAQENGNRFQLVDAVSNSSTPSAASETSSISIPTLPATTGAGESELSPILLGAILIGVALIAVCIFLIMKKRNAQRQPVQQAPQLPIPSEYTNNENIPILPEPVISPPTEMICGQCGRSCPTEAQFCPNCGHKMKGQ